MSARTAPQGWEAPFRAGIGPQDGEVAEPGSAYAKELVAARERSGCDEAASIRRTHALLDAFLDRVATA